MKILQNDIDQNIILDFNSDFKLDLEREESLNQFEEETLKNIINIPENYETTRYEHEPYVSGNNCNIDDLWTYFYFHNENSYDGGLDYSRVGISYKENLKMLKQSTYSFFKLEFYKLIKDGYPEKSNRKLVFSRNLSLPSGERIFYTPLNSYLFVPVFVGSNYRNRENMYFFWFQNDDAFKETMLSGNTFYMTARFFNADSGTILNFTNNPKQIDDSINEIEDIYYEVVIDMNNYTYKIYNYDGMRGTRVGTHNNPIKFYEVF